MPARRLGGDEGATTELVIAAPAFLFMIMLIVQAGLYFHASSIASAAAQEGARAATVQGGSIPEGRQVASDFVQTLAPRLLDDVEVDARYVDGGELVRMTVRGDVTEVFKLPGVDLDFTVQETSEGVIERFRPATDAPPTDAP
ncbi:MAG TPA: TadE/TadG family type IV pilus assembly protein [Jiangellaceae bacterium]|nr:TadE/TadG family type IV pilus assembly protein [Jiangellaceae bacterium]